MTAPYDFYRRPPAPAEPKRIPPPRWLIDEAAVIVVCQIIGCIIIALLVAWFIRNPAGWIVPLGFDWLLMSWCILRYEDAQTVKRGDQ